MPLVTLVCRPPTHSTSMPGFKRGSDSGHKAPASVISVYPAIYSPTPSTSDGGHKALCPPSLLKTTLDLLSTLPTNFPPIEMKFSASCASRRRISRKVRQHKYKCRTMLLPPDPCLHDFGVKVAALRQSQKRRGSFRSSKDQ